MRCCHYHHHRHRHHRHRPQNNKDWKEKRVDQYRSDLAMNLCPSQMSVSTAATAAAAVVAVAVVVVVVAMVLAAVAVVVAVVPLPIEPSCSFTPSTPIASPLLGYIISSHHCIIYLTTHTITPFCLHNLPYPTLPYPISGTRALCAATPSRKLFPGMELSGSGVGNVFRFVHIITHPLYLPYQYTLSIHPRNLSYHLALVPRKWCWRCVQVCSYHNTPSPPTPLIIWIIYVSYHLALFPLKLLLLCVQCCKRHYDTRKPTKIGCVIGLCSAQVIRPPLVNP